MRRLILIAVMLMVAVATAGPAAADTPTPTPTSTGAPALTPTAPPVVMLLVQAAVANVRGGPGTAYPVIGQGRKAQQFAVTGKNTGATWW